MSGGPFGMVDPSDCENSSPCMSWNRLGCQFLPTHEVMLGWRVISDQRVILHQSPTTITTISGGSKPATSMRTVMKTKAPRCFRVFFAWAWTSNNIARLSQRAVYFMSCACTISVWSILVIEILSTSFLTCSYIPSWPSGSLVRHIAVPQKQASRRASSQNKGSYIRNFFSNFLLQARFVFPLGGRWV